MKRVAGNVEAAKVANEVKADVEDNRCPFLILCPGITNSHIPLPLPPDQPKVRDLWDTTIQMKMETYHDDVATHFVDVVSPLPQSAQASAHERYLNMFGQEGSRNNAGYFLFRNTFTPNSGYQPRYRGPEFNFFDAFFTRKIVPLKDDPFILEWVRLWLSSQIANNTLIEVDTFQNYIYVSHSSKICWDLLLQGKRGEIYQRNAHPEPRIPTVSNAISHSAEVWPELCVFKCGPQGQVNDITCNGRAQCKKDCLSQPLCKGYYFNTTKNQGTVVTEIPLEDELANAAGTYNSFHALNRYDHSEANLAYNEKGTSSSRAKVVPMHDYVYEINRAVTPEQMNYRTQHLEKVLKHHNCSTEHLNSVQLANELSSEDAWKNISKFCPSARYHMPSETKYTSLNLCKIAEAGLCVKTTDGAVSLSKNSWHNFFSQWKLVRFNDPTPCKHKCMLDSACLAWTWTSSTCKHYVGLGSYTQSSVLPNLQVLEDLGFDVARPCAEDDHAFDMCLDQCVNIHNKLHHGWCNYKWVNCKAGKFAKLQTFIPDQQKGLSVCSGGSHPENNLHLGQRIARMESETNEETYQSSQSFVKQKFSFKLTNAKSSFRQPVEFLNGRQGAYTADYCGDIGTTRMNAADMSAWRAWSKEVLNTNVDLYMKLETNGTNDNSQHAWETLTFVGMSKGDLQSQDGSAYSSPAAGTSDRFADSASGQIHFPKCQIPTNRQAGKCTDVYSYTRYDGTEVPCSQKPFEITQQFYTLAEQTSTLHTQELQGTPFVGATFSKVTPSQPPKFTFDCPDTVCTAQEEGVTCIQRQQLGESVEEKRRKMFCCRNLRWIDGMCDYESQLLLQAKGSKNLLCLTTSASGVLTLTNNVAANTCSRLSSVKPTVKNVDYERVIADSSECKISTCQMDQFTCTNNICNNITFDEQNVQSKFVQMPSGSVCKEFQGNNLSPDDNLFSTLLSGFGLPVIDEQRADIGILALTQSKLLEFARPVPTITEIDTFQATYNYFYTFSHVLNNYDVVKGKTFSEKVSFSEEKNTAIQESSLGVRQGIGQVVQSSDSSNPFVRAFGYTPIGIVANKIQNVPIIGDAVAAVTTTAEDVVDVAFDAASSAGYALVDGLGSIGGLFGSSARRRRGVARPITTSLPLSLTPTASTFFVPEVVDENLQWKLSNIGFDSDSAWPTTIAADGKIPNYASQITYDATFEGQCQRKCEKVCKLDSSNPKCKFCVYQSQYPFSAKDMLQGLDMNLPSLWEFLRDDWENLDNPQTSCMGWAQSQWMKGVSNSRSILENKKIIAKNMLKLLCKVDARPDIRISEQDGNKLYYAPSSAAYTDPFYLLNLCAHPNMLQNTTNNFDTSWNDITFDTLPTADSNLDMTSLHIANINIKPFEKQCLHLLGVSEEAAKLAALSLLPDHLYVNVNDKNLFDKSKSGQEDRAYEKGTSTAPVPTYQVEWNMQQIPSRPSVNQGTKNNCVQNKQFNDCFKYEELKTCAPDSNNEHVWAFSPSNYDVLPDDGCVEIGKLTLPSIFFPATTDDSELLKKEETAYVFLKIPDMASNLKSSFSATPTFQKQCANLEKAHVFINYKQKDRCHRELPYPVFDRYAERYIINYGEHQYKYLPADDWSDPIITGLKKVINNNKAVSDKVKEYEYNTEVTHKDGTLLKDGFGTVEFMYNQDRYQVCIKLSCRMTNDIFFRKKVRTKQLRMDGDTAYPFFLSHERLNVKPLLTEKEKDVLISNLVNPYLTLLSNFNQMAARVQPSCFLSQTCTFEELKGVDPPMTTVFQMTSRQQSGTQSLAESVELDGLVSEHKALHESSVTGMIPRKGTIQNAQRSFASLGSEGQSTTYAPEPEQLSIQRELDYNQTLMCSSNARQLRKREQKKKYHYQRQNSAKISHPAKCVYDKYAFGGFSYAAQRTLNLDPQEFLYGSQATVALKRARKLHKGLLNVTLCTNLNSGNCDSIYYWSLGDTDYDVYNEHKGNSYYANSPVQLSSDIRLWKIQSIDLSDLSIRDGTDVNAECAQQSEKSSCISKFEDHQCVWLDPEVEGTTGKESQQRCEAVAKKLLADGRNVRAAVFAENEGSMFDPFANNICDIYEDSSFPIFAAHDAPLVDKCTSVAKGTCGPLYSKCETALSNQAVHNLMRSDRFGPKPAIVSGFTWSKVTEAICGLFNDLCINRCYDEEYCKYFQGTWLTDIDSEPKFDDCVSQMSSTNGYCTDAATEILPNARCAVDRSANTLSLGNRLMQTDLNTKVTTSLVCAKPDELLKTSAGFQTNSQQSYSFFNENVDIKQNSAYGTPKYSPDLDAHSYAHACSLFCDGARNLFVKKQSDWGVTANAGAIFEEYRVKPDGTCCCVATEKADDCKNEASRDTESKSSTTWYSYRTKSANEENKCDGVHEVTVFEVVCKDEPKQWGPRFAVTRNANKKYDGLEWKSFIATLPLSSQSTAAQLPGSIAQPEAETDQKEAPPDFNAANAGFKCPSGIYVGENIENEAPDSNDPDWHPLAQTTLMCPHNKPVRCSKMTVVNPVGGTCEYSSEAGKQQFMWSGQKQTPITEMAFQAENWKSKLGNNAPCHVYDFSCHSVEDDLHTNVCGVENKDSKALGGLKCGEDSTSGEGYCGARVENGERIGLKDASCAEWPHNGRSICPIGFTLKWSDVDGKPFCEPATRASKHKGVLRFDTKANTSNTDQIELWWPGFIKQKHSFAGVGPAYAAAFPSCDTSDGHSYHGFTGCDSLTDKPGLANLNSILQKCCAKETAQSSNVNKNMCFVSPTSKCGGGNYIHNRPDFLQ